MTTVKAWGWVVALMNGTLCTLVCLIRYLGDVVSTPGDSVNIILLAFWAIETIVIMVALPGFFRFFVSIRDRLTGEVK